eukprot:TRINITY_DN51547_c0_g1_i1.p1 TRINITY_DN51547_c0_g1~~TRINITY_DN51547_c0_g1_i1.p1  ORF type:complete len:149 (+),score=52.39 TRINITY_DN51547_c0_g1_i1:90-536(+)
MLRSLVGSEMCIRDRIAMFEADKTSRSKAVKFLERRGISPQLLEGGAEYSRNTQLVLKHACEEAETQGHHIVGTEDLLYAIFAQPKNDAQAKHFMITQHVIFPESLRKAPARTSDIMFQEEQEQEESVVRMLTAVSYTHLTLPTKRIV